MTRDGPKKANQGHYRIEGLTFDGNISADERVYGAISGKSEKHGYRLVRDIRLLRCRRLSSF
jgi:hypothetical protein